jgi:caffeoyl-CoA O-methyltransferase
MFGLDDARGPVKECRAAEVGHTMKTFGTSSIPLSSYVERTFVLEDPVLESIRASAERAGLPPIEVSPFDARHLEVITRAIAARRAVELGTLGGYSAASIARGLADNGMLFTIEASAKHAKVASESLARHGLAHRVRVIVGAALDELPKLSVEGPFDLVFLDAEKTEYPQYLAWAEDNLRTGGVLLADNAFGFGGVADPEAIAGGDPAATAMHVFNDRLARGGRFVATMIPTSEGLAMGVKIR